MRALTSLVERVRAHLEILQPGLSDEARRQLADRVVAAIGIDPDTPPTPADPTTRWGPSDTVLITYGDSIVDGDRPPLQVLEQLVAGHLTPSISMVHVLPFYPYTSDRGFSVIDHTAVDPALGTWDDIGELAGSVDLMVDFVCNHLSSQSAWFQQFLADESPGRDAFVTVADGTDTSAVVRPRAQPLIQHFDTAAGPRNVWCTFSRDQVDVDHSEPEVMLALLKVLDHYVRSGARFIRLDAVAYLWKELGTSCIHLPETHEMIRLWHTLLAWRSPRASLVTETNVPNRENLTYFGNRDEAHLIYNFSLPPMIIDAMLNGRSEHLRAWMAAMPPAPLGCTYFNFLSSHDGIGVRPAEGLLNDAEIGELVEVTTERGGLHGTYDSPSGPRPYELNISLWDLLADPTDDPATSTARFVCAHAIMFATEGIPAIYVNSLFAQGNDRATADATGSRRDISRARMPLATAVDALGHPATAQGAATAALLRLLDIRRAQAAFHPNATQFTLQLGDELFGFWRQSLDRAQSIFAIHNCTNRPQKVSLHQLNLIGTDEWTDLVSGALVDDLHGEVALGPYGVAWLTNG